MKKSRLLIIITTITILLLCCSCRKSEPEILAETTSISTLNVDDTHESIIKKFWNEYQTRSKAEEYFSISELKQLNEIGLEFKSNYEPPVVVTADGEQFFYPVFIDDSSLFAIDEYGTLLELYEDDFISSHVHVGKKLEEVQLMSSPWASIYYIQSTGEIQYWSQGDLIQKYYVPANSVYAGHGYWCGHLFRSQDKVYSVMAENNRETEVNMIAKNVKQIISADYYFSSDAWSQPLFLMENDSVKAYITWYGDENNHADTGHLKEIEQDGGYIRTYFPLKENR